jgi:hypothetical protein
MRSCMIIWWEHTSKTMLAVRFSNVDDFSEYMCVGVSKPGGSLDRWVNRRRVPQPRWVDARRNAKGGKEAVGGRQAWESGSRGLRVSPAPESGALAVGGYKRPRGSGSERPCASAVPSFSARANPKNPRKRALVLPFIGVRRGSRCTMGSVAMC